MRVRSVWCCASLGLLTLFVSSARGDGGVPETAADFGRSVRPLLAKYCLGCHSTKAKKGSLDLERYATIDDLRKDVKPWQAMIEQIESGEMPPKEKAQPSAAEKKQLVDWVRGFLEAEARARRDDPGAVPLRRLSNAEYDATIRDLTGVDLRPAREFPADGAGGEGFTNAAESLSDVSPALFARYLGAAKVIAEHAVLLPDGFRFSPSKTRRDWTDEGIARLRQEYAKLAPADGKLDVRPFLMATIRHREDLRAGKFDAVAVKEKLNAKYLRILWQALTNPSPSQPLGEIRKRWRDAKEADAAALVKEIAAEQAKLWKVVKIGSYIAADWHGPPGSAFIESLSRQMAVDPPEPKKRDGQSDAEEIAAFKQSLAGRDAFRKLFPLFVCFPQVVPTDEVVCLKMFHREDEPLERLFLDAEQKRTLDRLWQEHIFVSRQPVAEYDYLPQFMGFTTQDTPKALQQFFIDRKPLFKKHADEFLKAEEAAFPKQMETLLTLADRAYRRPLSAKDKAELQTLYGAIRKKGASHDEAFRGTLARVLVAPPFLFRIETAPPGAGPSAVNDWELATRLSYFLGSSMPDDELRRLAAAGKLRDPEVLAEQTGRLLKDPRSRMLAIEFGTQWIHVRGFDALEEKNEKLFPTFDAKLREAIYEESILFFDDLFRNDRPVGNLLDADYTFLNETLAKHYGIPGVAGAQWRRVDGVRKYGRGGILGLASVHAKQSGASRTSPVLRGNWVVETLLGEKLPRPPANVPILPDRDGIELTTRQMVERHASDAACATCHIRIDPFGFAFENFDAIGRWRIKETSGLPVDARAKLKDGTEFEGIDGLRRYLMTQKKDVIVRLFCKRLLGYALGRATTLSDTALIDEMMAKLQKNDGRISAAVLTIVRSPQFRMIRGRDMVASD